MHRVSDCFCHERATQRCLELVQDPFDQDDWEAYAEFNAKCGKDVLGRKVSESNCIKLLCSQDIQIVGDDL